MATLAFGEVAGIAVFSGLPGDPVLWAYVAKHESSLRTDVVNSIGAVGLWQINQPVHVKKHPAWTVKYLQDPWNNARAAKEIYRSQGWAAWTAYPAAKAEYDKNNGDPPKGTTKTDQLKEAVGAGDVGAAARDAVRAGQWIANPTNLLRVVYVAAGGVLIIAGAAALAKPVIDPMISQTRGAVAGFVTKGKAGKAK